MPDCPMDRIDMRAIALPQGGTEYACIRCNGLWLPGRLVPLGASATALVSSSVEEASLYAKSERSL